MLSFLMTYLPCCGKEEKQNDIDMDKILDTINKRVNLNVCFRYKNVKFSVPVSDIDEKEIISILKNIEYKDPILEDCSWEWILSIDIDIDEINNDICRSSAYGCSVFLDQFGNIKEFVDYDIPDKYKNKFSKIIIPYINDVIPDIFPRVFGKNNPYESWSINIEEKKDVDVFTIISYINDEIEFSFDVVNNDKSPIFVKELDNKIMDFTIDLSNLGKKLRLRPKENTARRTAQTLVLPSYVKINPGKKKHYSFKFHELMVEPSNNEEPVKDMIDMSLFLQKGEGTIDIDFCDSDSLEKTHSRAETNFKYDFSH